MKEVIYNVRVSDIPAAIRQLGLPEDMSVHLTIEDQDDKQQGLTDAKLEELLADES